MIPARWRVAMSLAAVSACAQGMGPRPSAADDVNEDGSDGGDGTPPAGGDTDGGPAGATGDTPPIADTSTTGTSEDDAGETDASGGETGRDEEERREREERRRSDPSIAYYVDPDVELRAGDADGSAAAPWAHLGPAQWATLDEALGDGDVIVYFSARNADEPSAQDYGDHLEVGRTNDSGHRLVLDGVSRFNVDDDAPRWADNDSEQRLRLTGHSSLGLGWYPSAGLIDDVTLRGFEVTGAGARVTVGGNRLVLERLHVHDVTGLGPAVHTFYATNPEGSCTETVGVYEDVTIRDCRIERTFGEAIYIGGTNDCPAYGNSHSGIRVLNNTILDAGSNGGQGDGIDVKDGIVDGLVQGNIIVNAGNNGIVTQGAYGDAQNLRIDGNWIEDPTLIGISVASTWGDPSGVVVSNNIVFAATTGVSVSGASTNVRVLHNTLYANDTGVALGELRGGVVAGNLLLDSDEAALLTWGGTTAVHHHNAYAPGGLPSGEGEGSIETANTNLLVVAPARGDFHLVEGCEAIDAAVDVGVETDIDGAARPIGPAADIGAYEMAR